MDDEAIRAQVSKAVSAMMDEVATRPKVRMTSENLLPIVRKMWAHLPVTIDVDQDNSDPLALRFTVIEHKLITLTFDFCMECGGPCHCTDEQGSPE